MLLSSTFASTIILSYVMHLIIHILVFPIVSLRDTNASTNVPTTVEYNIQTNSIVGVLLYIIASWFLLMTYSVTITNEAMMKWIMSVCNWTPQFIALSIAACYEYNGNLFLNCYCLPDTRKPFERIIQQASFPAYLVLLFLLSFVPSFIEQQYNNSITVSMLLYFAYRIAMIISDFCRSRRAKAVTYPEQTVMTIRVHDNFPTTKLLMDDTNMKQQQHTNVWKIYGQEYDVTDFVHYHPGGVESIMLAANRDDATALFQSYHPFTIRKAKSVLEKYRISNKTKSDEEMKQLQGTYPTGHHNDLLYEELVKRVAKTLSDNGIDPVKDRYATWTRYVFYTVLVAAVATSVNFHVKGNVLGSIFLGFWGAYMGAHIGHDGGHYAISKFPWINNILIWCLTFISNPIVWQHQHTYAHHSYTNEYKKDPDLHHFSLLMRTNPLQKLLPQHKMQKFVLYIFFAYTFTSNGTLYWNLWRFIFERSSYGTVEWTDRKRWYRTALLMFHMFAYPICNFVVPYWYHKNAINAIVCGVTNMTIGGFLFALLAEVAHLTEMTIIRDVDSIDTSRTGIAKGSWAAEQVETTNDFCIDNNSYIMKFFGASLNEQIEHHLFPGLNHCHLQMIQPTVEETCKEYGIVYKRYNSWSDAMSDTVAYLKKISYENVDYMQNETNISTKKLI